MTAMLQMLLDQVNSFGFEEAGGLVLFESAGLEDQGNVSLRLRLECDGERTPWRIACRGVRDHRLQFGWMTGAIDLYDDHPLLSEIVEDRVNLYVSRPAADPARVALALIASHSPMLRRWFSETHFFNAGVPPQKVLASYGLLASGPKSVMKGYAEVLSANAVGWSAPRGNDSPYYRTDEEVWTNGEHELRVLVLGGSYVIAAGFEAEQTDLM
ncbi:MAG: hypothetical protein NTW19_03110 [Planctomycetota bacterium]|nr:hypothetical protein [Planctomycetota bacterium]